MRVNWKCLPMVIMAIFVVKTTTITVATGNTTGENEKNGITANSNADIMAKLEAQDEKIDMLSELLKSKIKKDESIEKEELSIADQMKALKKDIIHHMTEESAKRNRVNGGASKKSEMQEYSEKDADNLAKTNKNAGDRINKMVDKVEKLKADVEEAAEKTKKKINNDATLSAEKKEEYKKEVDEKSAKLVKGADNSMSAYKKLEVNVAMGGGGYTGSRKTKALDALSKFGDKLGASTSLIRRQWIGSNEDFEEMAGGVIDNIGNLMTVFDPSADWEDRVEAGLGIAETIVGFLPPPFGTIGTSLLGLFGAFFGAAAPTPNEFKELRNDILNGVSEMFDDNQKAEAMGCVYKLEFLKDVLDTQESEAFSDEEFNAIVIAGGIDAGVVTLGTLKWKMENFRDKNQILSGRQSLEMAHFYVLVANARDMLNKQIIMYLQLSDETSGGGFTTDFFKKTRDVAQKEYKDLFWWDDLCCEKDAGHFSAMLAYSLPLNKHSGKGNAVENIQRFLKTHRTEEYYDRKSNDMKTQDALFVDTASKDSSPKVGKIDVIDPAKYYTFGTMGDINKMLGLAKRSSEKPNKVWYWFGDLRHVKCSTNNAADSFAYRVGMVDKLDDSTLLQIKFINNEEDGDPFQATVTMLYPETKKEYFMLSLQTLLTHKKLFIDEQNNHDSRPENRKKFEKDMIGGYYKWDIVALCSKGEKYVEGGSPAPANFKEEEIKAGSIRFFPVKFSSWGETRYLIGPAAAYIDDNLILFGTGTEDQKAKMELPKNTLLSEEEGRPEMTEEVLNKAEWKNLFFTIRAETSDREDKGQFTYPAGSHGFDAEMRCMGGWMHGTPTFSGTKNFYSMGDLSSYQRCASTCIWRKTKDPAGKQNIGAAVVSKPSTSPTQCTCYNNVTGHDTSTRNTQETCFFETVGKSVEEWYCVVKLKGGVQVKSVDLKTAQDALGVGNDRNEQAIIPMIGSKAGDPHKLPKSWSGGSMFWQGWDEINKMRNQCSKLGWDGCCFNMDVYGTGEEKLNGKYYLLGGHNGHNQWLKSDGQRAIWYTEEKQWCLGHESKQGENCGEGMIFGKNTAGTPINCPTDSRLTWYKDANTIQFSPKCLPGEDAVRSYG